MFEKMPSSRYWHEDLISRLRIANRGSQTAVSNRRGIWGHESRAFRSLAILDLDRAISPI